MAGEEEDTYWNESKAKGFSWDEEDDSLGVATLSLTTSQSKDDLVSFEVGPVSSDTRWEARVREAVKQLSTAASQPEPSISEVLGRQEAGNPQAEIQSLRKSLARLQQSKFAPDPPAETIRNFILGKPYSLEAYRSLQSKENLLDCALEYGDGDAILAVSLMLRSTLKRQKFLAVMSCRPLAVEHLVSHMITRHELTQVIDLLSGLGRFHEAGLVAYRQALSSSSIEYRVRNLKQVLMSQLSGHVDADIVMEQINFLDRVMPVMSAESAHADRHPNQLATGSLLKLLLYCCQHYWEAPETLLYSPIAIRKMHKLSEKQFTWVAVRGRVLAQSWSDCESLLVGRGWLGGVKAKGGVTMTDMATALHDGKAPPETLAVIIQAIDSPSDRLELAKKLMVHSVVVDVLLAHKDRLALTKYRDSLTLNSRDWFYADNALQTANVKWKN